MPAGTVIDITTTTGAVTTNKTFTIGNGNPITPAEINAATTYPASFTSGTLGETGLIQIKVTAPTNNTSSFEYLDIL